MTPSPWPRWFGGVLLAVTALLLAVYAGAPVTTNDLFWHVNTGAHLWQAGGFPDRDVFSYTTGGLEWVLHEWLTQLVFYGLFEIGGLTGLRLFTAAFAGLLLWQVHRFAAARLRDPMVVALVVLVFAGLGVARLQTRPTLFSMALFLAEVAWLLRQRGAWRARQTAVLLGLVLLWVNLHSVGLLSVVVFGAFAAGRLAQFLLRMDGAPGRVDLGWYAGAGVAALAASCLNPSGWGLYSFAWQDKGIVMNFVVDEWGAFRPAFGDNPLLSPVAYALVLGVLAAVLVAALWTGAALSRQPDKARSPAFPDPVDLAMVVLCVAGALMARRFLWLLAIALVLSAAHLRRLWLAHPRAARAPGLLRAGLAGAALALLAAVYHVDLRYERRPLHALLAGGYGRDIAPSLDLPGVRFMRAVGLTGNAFCHYGSGGMLSWFLYPDVRVFIDSRVDLYRRQVFLDFLRVRDGHPRQQEILDAYGTDIYYRHWEIAGLRDPSGWRRVYAGPDGEVWLRETPRNAANLGRIEAWRQAQRAVPPR